MFINYMIEASAIGFRLK